MPYTFKSKLLSALLSLTPLLTLLVPLGSRAADISDYGYIFVADEGNDNLTKIEPTVYLTKEFDLSGCTNPVLLCSSLSYATIYTSADGVTFSSPLWSKLTGSTNKLFKHIASLPLDTRYIKVELTYERADMPLPIVIAEVEYGKNDFESSATLEPITTAGTYKNGTLYYDWRLYEWSDIKGYNYASVTLNIPETSQKILRTLNAKFSSTRVTISGTINCKDGKTVNIKSNAFSRGLPEILLPYDAVSVNLELKDEYNEEIDISFSVSSYFNDPTPVDPATPMRGLELYYDIDGDGIFESIKTYGHSYLAKFAKLSDGSWYLRRGNNKSGFDELYRMEPDGMLYGMAQYMSQKSLVRSAGPDSEVESVYTFPYQKGTPMDYDLDGQTDYLYMVTASGPQRVLALAADGSAFENNLTTMTPAEYAGVRSELKLSTGGEGIPGWGDMFGRDNASPGTFGTASVVDINSDGIPDFIDQSTGDYFLNTGDGSFVESSFGNRVCFRDFDGDGINDILEWDYQAGDVWLYPGADVSKEPVRIFATNPSISNVYVRDVDNDGDLDVIAFINSNYFVKATESYLLIGENQGNGKFRKREHYIAEGIDITDLLDIDADGKYEAICANGLNSHRNAYIAKIISPTEVSVEPFGDENESCKEVFPVRPDQSGQWILYITNGSSITYSRVYPANSRPQRPEAAPTLVFDPNTSRLNVSWPLGSDRETPALDLTYELRIGTAPGLGDIVMAQALPDGSRRNLLAGLNGYSTQAVYNTESWPEGKIYISYQVVDDGFMGSEFSEAAVFEKTVPATGFKLSLPTRFATRMTAEAIPAVMPQPGNRYTWDVADGEIVEIDEATQTLTFRFQTPGDKTVSLTVENGSGIQWTSSKSFKVAPLNFTENDQEFSKVIDLDGDGYGEVFSFGKFYTENDEGVYESVKKSFNSATGLSSHTYMADVNSDGLMDMFYRDIFLINYGDGDMEQVTKAYEKDHKWQIYDFNNDGLKDVSPRLLNAGDYTSAVNSNVTFDPPAASFGFYPANMYYYDYNGDGLVDVGMIAAVSSTLFSDRLPFHIYENIDGYSYKKGVEIPSITSEPAMVDDLDGDGKADIVMCDASYAFGVTFYGEYIVIIWGSGAPETKIRCPDGDPFRSITGAFDFNNDGMKDLSACLQNSNKVVVLHRDGSYEFVDAKYSVNPDAVTRRHNGNLIFTNSTLLSESNQRPTAPTDLRSSQSNGAVVIEWNAGTDKETPTTALRYNIGIKRKGAEGEGAFFISPMNGLNAQCALPSDMYLLTSPRIKIPVASIPAGEYEVSVQTVDGQYDTSEFSEIYELTVRTSAVVDMPSSGMIGSAVAVKIMTNAAASDIDFGTDAKVMSEIGNTRNVVWNSEGLKEIKVNGEKVGGIYIYPAPEANFTLPEKVVEGALVHVTGTAVDKGVWEIGTADGKFTILSPEAPANVESIGTDTLSVRFNGIGILTLRHTVEESYGSAVCERTAEVGGGVPSIDMVTAQDQYHQILWNVESVPADALAVRVYRESARYNVFDVVAELPVTSGEYVDFKSDVAVKSTRYRLSYVMPYGESTLSAAHQPMHLQVNRGQATSINLSWSRYEGMEVDSYRILKGSDASNLSTLDVVSGHLTSFTDLSDDASTSYYSVEVVPLAEDSQSRRTSAKFASGAIASRSNVVSGRDARAIVQAEQVIVTSTTGSPEFNGAPVLQLQARMLPTNASITKVNWTMVEGDDIMSVDAYGNVTAMAYGEATVRAIATDGSGAYGDIRLVNSAIPLTWLEFTAWPVNHTLATGETFQYQIKTEPLNASEKPLWESSDTEVAEITQEGLVTALRPGETDIYVRSQLDPSMLISLPLTVIRSADFVNVTSITFDVNDISGVPGDVFDLTVKVLPDNATDKRVEWHMLPKTTDVATVDADGRLTITGTGSAYVSAVSVSNPTVVATLKVNGVSGLESVFYDNDVRCDVYNTSGILLLRQASREDVERLQPGIYIAGGRKICVLPRI